MKKYLKELGKDYIKVRSAGVGAMGGFGPTAETIEVLKKEGVNVTDFRSTRLTDELIKESDLILVMEGSHKDEILTRVPDAASKTHLLKRFGRDEKSYHPEGFSIPDPIGRSMKDYEYCIMAIRQEIERIAKLL